ncbi:MAG: adenylate kinase [Dehalococcoidia bacterium]
MYVVLLGAPGAGKGTQAAIISQKTGLTHIASGDLFRQAVQKGTELGKLVKSYMDKGELAPDEVTIKVIMERLSEPDCEKGCIFDGFPRTLDQAKALDKKLAEQKKGIDKAVFIDVPDEELMKRLGGRWTCKNCQAVYHEVASPPKVAGICDKCGGELYQRPDDNEATIRERLKVYFNQTTPVLDYYKNDGKLIAVDGKLSIDEVAEKVIEVLNG